MIQKGESKWTPGYGCFALALILPVGSMVVLAWPVPRIGLGSGEFGFLRTSIVIFAFVLAALIVLVIPLLGPTWAPFAAWFSAKAARLRGLDSRRLAVAGAIYSTL